MTNSCVHLQRPIDAATVNVLARLAQTAKAQDVDVLLVGAFARDILFLHMHGIEPGRRTEDVDFSVQVRSWAAFDRLRKALGTAEFTPVDVDHPEKLRDGRTGREIDLVPFGPIAGPSQMLTWPNNGPTWNLKGLDDAFAHAVRLALADTGTSPLTVPLITLSSLVMLKIVSLSDRPKDRKKKDGTDIGFVLQHYLEAGNRERLLAEHGDLVASAARDHEVAGAVLLGRDMRKVASSSTRAYLVERLLHETTSQSACPLAQSLAQSTCKGRFPRARQLLTSLLEGLDTNH